MTMRPCKWGPLRFRCGRPSGVSLRLALGRKHHWKQRKVDRSHSYWWPLACNCSSSDYLRPIGPECRHLASRAAQSQVNAPFCDYMRLAVITCGRCQPPIVFSGVSLPQLTLKKWRKGASIQSKMYCNTNKRGEPFLGVHHLGPVHMGRSPPVQQGVCWSPLSR